MEKCTWKCILKDTRFFENEKPVPNTPLDPFGVLKCLLESS